MSTKYEAGPVLNRLIAEKVMGWSLYHYDKGGRGDEYWSVMDSEGNPVCYESRQGRYVFDFDSENEAWGWFKPSADIAQAWQVVERMADLRYVFLIKADGYREPDNAPRYTVLCANLPRVDHESAPMAICLGALQALAKGSP